MHHLNIRDLNVWYGTQHVLKQVTVDIPRHRITAVVGPSGCGKTTLLKSLNRLIELQPGARVSGQVLLDGVDVYQSNLDVTEIRARVGLLAQKPFPLPMSIYDNVAYGPRIHGLGAGRMDALVREHLEAVGLWSEVQERLKAPATSLSVGQQQRLCLARTLAIEPEVLLCDESTSALDPISAQLIEEHLCKLSQEYTIIIVTHNLAQARRIADYAIVLWLGEVVEHGLAERVFDEPWEARTREYLAREG